MTYCVYIACGLFMIICQTTVLPRLAFVGYCFHLLLPLVVYLAAFRPLHEALPFTVFLGVLMDHLSVGPFGLYLTSYVRLFIAARAAATVVRAEHPIMIVLMSRGVALQWYRSRRVSFSHWQSRLPFSVGFGQRSASAAARSAGRCMMLLGGWSPFVR